MKHTLLRFLVFIACMSVLVTACTPPKGTGSTPRPPRPNQPTQPTKPAPGKMDTIKWSQTDPNTRPPITDKPNSGGGGTKPNSGNNGNTGGTKPSKPAQNWEIGLLLPFQTKAWQAAPDKMPEQSALATQFYGGAQIALIEASESLKSSYKVEVLDTDLTDDAMRTELNKVQSDNWDVIIGPMRSSQVQVLSNRTQSRKTVLISPQSVQPNLVKNYPTMVQTSVGLENHCRTIGEYVLSKYKGDQIVLVCREKEKERLAWFAAIHGWPAAAVRTLVLPDNTASITQSLKTYVSVTKETVFILPSFGSQDFVNGFLTKLRTDKGKNAVAVFGMPQWEEFDAIDYDLLEANRVHITRDYFWNAEGDDFKTFQKQYFDQFGMAPDKDAVKGYDIMRWVTQGLEQEGLDFAGSGARYNGLGYQFRLKSVIGTDGTVQYTENVQPRILRFENLQLLPIDGL